MKILNNLKSLIFIIKRDLLHIIIPYNSEKLNFQQKQILENIKKDGCDLIEQFYDKTQCDNIIKIIDSELANKQRKIWVGSLEADLRIFGINHISPEVNSFWENTFIRTLVNTYEKSDACQGFTMAGKISYKEKNLGSGEGWHRDRWDFKQTKTILYLNDVDVNGGPFEYILYSHKPIWIMKDFIFYGISPFSSRISLDQIEKIKKSEPYRLKTLSANAGDLLFADTRGIHRGKPIGPTRRRYALTNYSWYGSNIPEHILQISN